MATPNDRRVIWGSHVVPQVSLSTTSTQVTREEGSTAGTALVAFSKLLYVLAIVAPVKVAISVSPY